VWAITTPTDTSSVPPKGTLQANNRSTQNSSAITLLYISRLGVVAEEFFKDEFAENALFYPHPLAICRIVCIFAAHLR